MRKKKKDQIIREKRLKIQIKVIDKLELQNLNGIENECHYNGFPAWRRDNYES